MVAKIGLFFGITFLLVKIIYTSIEPYPYRLTTFAMNQKFMDALPIIGVFVATFSGHSPISPHYLLIKV